MNKSILTILLSLFFVPALYGIFTNENQQIKTAPVAAAVQSAVAYQDETKKEAEVPYKFRIIDPEYPSVSSVAKNPKSFIGKTIGFRRASCADDPKGSFVCRVVASGRTIRIEAGGLGPSGGDEVAERLIGPCKGRDKIGNRNCIFDIVIEPTSAQSEDIMEEFKGERFTRFYSNIIEMKVSEKK